jgi:hypothetical protein
LLGLPTLRWSGPFARAVQTCSSRFPQTMP